jgi:tRNA(Arg) A34 adenosine deaminase TadA
MNDNFLTLAIEKSRESVSAGGFPVGVVLVRGGEIIATGLSDGKQLNDPTSHAEIAAIREACQKLKTRNLKD